MTDSVAAVQKRPGMYVGDTTDGTGLHNLVCEIVRNAIKETLVGGATQIFVTLNSDGSCTVHDNGRGLPTDLDPMFGTSAAEVIMTHLHSAGRYHGYSPRILDVGGIGACVVNALAEWLELRIWRDGAEHHMRFRQGRSDAPLRIVGDVSGKHGTEVTFLPSATVFAKPEFDVAILGQRLAELAALNSDATLTLVDSRH